jgi:hypothetical protein
MHQRFLPRPAAPGSRVTGFVLAAAAAALLASAPARAAYTFQDFSNPADLTFNQLLGINNAGMIGGYYGSGATGHPNQGYTLNPSGPVFTPENFPGSAQTQVVAINTAGDTAGFYIDQNGLQHGFTNLGGTFNTVDNPLGNAAGAGGSQLLSLNDNGFAAGFYVDANGNDQGFSVHLGSSPTFSPLSFLPGNTVMSQAGGINNAGNISGFYETPDPNNPGGTITAGFLYNPTTHTLTTLQFPGSNFTQGFGLNNNGQVTGVYVDTNGIQHGFVWQAGNFTTIDAPNGAAGSTVLNGINDAGQVVGFFADNNDNTVGLRATPGAVPEPASVVLLGIGGLTIAGLFRRRAAKG